jgi:RHS repeat-associated protein
VNAVGEKEEQKMKNRILQVAVVLGLTAAALSVQAGKLPEFMNAQQLTAWRAQHAAPQAEVAPVPDEQTQFFTGKPFDAASGTYLFIFRNYSPYLARWTSADPCGFPDGANNMAYEPVPTIQLDPYGLMTVNGGTIEYGSPYENKLTGMWGGMFNYATYRGRAYASAGATSGALYLTSSIGGYNTFSLWHSILLTPTIKISEDANGNLNYAPAVGSFGKADGVVGEGLSYTFEGAGTKTLTFHIWGAWALSATSVNGVGASPSISFTGATMSDNPVALGTFIFQE